MTLLSKFPANILPAELSSFIGRERELAEITALLATTRLLSLTGAGGCGKTRLAQRLAAEVLSRQAGGVCWIELAALSDPALVPQAAAKALHVVEQPGRTGVEAVVDFLRDRQVWLVLDNCEHLLATCAALAAAVLRAAPGARILATSREPLAVAGEQVYPVAPLSLPAADGPGAVEGSDAVRLFLDRARTAVPNFKLTSKNAAAVAEICRRLDGIPLAIELACARVNVLTVQQIADRLDDRFALLASGPRESLPHQRTLRATIDWSYDSLPLTEQILFQRLSTLAGGFTLASAQAVCSSGDLLTEQIPAALFALVNKSLVAAETLRGADARYRLLETLAVYAQEKLSTAGQAALIYDRHLDHFADLAAGAARRLRGPQPEKWLVGLETELANFRVALHWALDSDQIEAGLRLANALAHFWHLRGYLQEGRDWFERLLERAGDEVPPETRAEAAGFDAMLAFVLGQAAAGQARARQAMALGQAAGEAGKPVLARAMIGLAGGAREAGDSAGASHLLARSAELWRELGNKPDLALTLQLQALVLMDQHDFAAARPALEESLELARELQDVERSAHVNNYLGDVARCEQNYPRAQSAYQASLAQFEEIGARRDVAGLLHNLAYTHLHQGRAQAAEAMFRESLATQQALRNEQGMAECLTGLAAIAAVRGLPEPAARLLGAAAAHGRDGLAQWPAERMEYDHCLELVQALLTAEQFDQANEQGRALSLEQAVNAAMNLPQAPGQPREKPGEPEPAYGGLSLRERQVAALMGQGKTNAEIAAELVVSKRTVESHVAHILSKLALASRGQVVRWAIGQGLAETTK